MAIEKPNRINLVLALVAVIGSIIGAIGGSWITGSYMLKSQEIQLKKDLSLLSGQNAQQELDIIRNKSEAYFLKVTDYIQFLETKGPSNKERVKSHLSH